MCTRFLSLRTERIHSHSLWVSSKATSVKLDLTVSFDGICLISDKRTIYLSSHLREPKACYNWSPHCPYVTCRPHVVTRNYLPTIASGFIFSFIFRCLLSSVVNSAILQITTSCRHSCFFDSVVVTVVARRSTLHCFRHTQHLAAVPTVVAVSLRHEILVATNSRCALRRKARSCLLTGFLSLVLHFYLLRGSAARAVRTLRFLGVV